MNLTCTVNLPPTCVFRFLLCFQKELDKFGRDSIAKGVASSAFHAANLPAALEICASPVPSDSDVMELRVKEFYRKGLGGRAELANPTRPR